MGPTSTKTYARAPAGFDANPANPGWRLTGSGLHANLPSARWSGRASQGKNTAGEPIMETAGPPAPSDICPVWQTAHTTGLVNRAARQKEESFVK